VDLERYRSIVDDWSAFAEAAGRREPTVFRIRTGRIAEDDLLERLRGRGFRTRPLEGLPSFHTVEEGPRAVSLTPEHWHGLIYVQQASTGVAAPALNPRPGERVLDLCAAPGGKTTHLSELMRDSGCLVACEISESRIRGLLGNVYRLGHTNVLVVAGDGRKLPDGATFDRVLVDAPCSGEGTLRRRGGRAPRQSPSFRGFVTNAQRELLERAVRLTRPGGTILYVTCTFAPEENEAVVSDALQRLPVDLEGLDLPVPHARGVVDFEGVRFDPRVEGAARIYPHHLDSGGLFLARLRRLDDGDPPGERRAHAGSASEQDSGRDLGWGPVTALLPREHREADGARPLAPEPDGSMDRAAELAEAETLIETGVADLADRYGVDPEAHGMGWLVRGGRAWAHTLDSWPLGSWTEGDAWRPVSVGIRAVEFDTQGRPRPTNDLLRLLGPAVRRRVVDLDDGGLADLLHRRPVPVDTEDRGPYALRYGGEIIGRGAVTEDGLKSEIPKARAADLRRCLPALDD
jgi:NOL1/NOP2/sun family putative RNA methylase